MAFVIAALASRSPRYLGKMTPRETASTWWPARPIRCMPLATEVGVSIWTTRSTAPMSMPSSSEEVATSAGSRPALSASSISSALLARDRAVVGAGDLLAGQLVERGRQPLGQAAAVDEDDRRAVRAHELEQPRVDRRPDRAPLQRRRPALRRMLRRRPAGLAAAPRAAPCPRPAPRPAGRRPSSPRRRRSSPAAASTCAGPRRRPGSAPPPRAGAASPRGRSAAAAGAPPRAAARARARGARRASCRRGRGSRRRSPCRPTARIARAREVSSRKSDSGVVIRMSGRPAQHRRALGSAACRRCGRRPRAGARPRRAGRRRARCRRAACAGCARRRPRAP